MRGRGRAARWIWVAVVAVAVHAASALAASSAQLNVSTWGFNLDLIRKNITEPFERTYGITINYELGNNADRLTKILVRRDNPNVDVVQLAEYFTAQAVKEGVLQPIDPSRLKNYNQLYDWAKDPLGGHYGIAFTVYSYGIAYRTDKVSRPITSWRDLWRPELAGHVSLPDITTTEGPATIVMASRAWGGDEKSPDVGFRKLRELRDNVVTFYNRSSQLISLFQQGEVWAAPVARFAWGSLLATGLPLRWVAPEEGLVGSLNLVSIVKGAKNLDAAYKYIDHLISEPVQTAQALDLVDSPTNRFVRVPAEKAQLLTYGDEVSRLTFLDAAYILSVRDQWVQRWNREIAF